MKYAKFYAFCACVFLLCTVCLTFTVSAASSPHYTVIAVPHEENGILTTENGQKWYKVKGFENDTQYILTVRDRDGVQNILAVTNDVDTAGIWSFYRSSMSTSTAPRIATLSAAGYSMTCSGNKLMPYYDGVEAGDRTWAHENSMLCWYGSDRTMYLKYNPGSDEPFSMTADRTQAAEVLIYSCGTTLTRCITQQPQAESYVIEGSSYPAPSFSVGLADVTVDSIRWFADGAEQPCGTPVFTADILKDQPAGVHRVSCAVAAHDSDGYHYREQSAEATFVITKGVVPDSIMTFSDIHEEYGLIRDAIRTVMQKTGGYIPALVICSGDFVNGPTMQTDLELSRYFPQIVSALGGLDAVYVAGNHDSAEAAALMSSAAGLGAAKNLPAAGGVIFDGESEAVAQNGKNSRSAKGIINYGINYDAALRRMDDGSLYRTYEDVIRSVDSFLKETAAQYHGELVVISAHSGLHVVGLQPDSENGYYSPQYGWAGENAYNIDMSCELAQTLNRYAEQYDMNILYLYGHDHSRSEQEIFLTDGDTLISPKRYDNRSYENVTLHFTYANAGYLSSVIGSASKKFSFIQRDGSSLTYDLLRSAGSSVRHAEWKEKHPYEAPAGTTETPAVTTSAARTSAAETTAAAQKSAAPDTGDYGMMLLLAVPACLALLLTGKKHAP